MDAGVDGSAVIEEGTVDGLDSYGASFVERGGDRVGSGGLWCARAIDGC